MELTINGKIPSKKNSKQISFNRRTGKRFVRSSDRYLAWQTDILYEIKCLPAKRYFDGPIKIEYLFEVKKGNRSDVDNMIATINDILQESSIIENDLLIMEGYFKVVHKKEYSTTIKIESLRLNIK
jgi:Holliday junction resolvase RusA-like endonuclease